MTRATLLTTRARAAAPGLDAATAVRTVTLPTGDRVELGRGVVPSTSLTGYVQLDAGGQQYVFPISVMGELGRTLDPSLFDVTALARVERGTRIPVTTHRSSATEGATTWLGGSDERTVASSIPVPHGEYLSLHGAASETRRSRRVHEHTVTFRATSPTGHPATSGVALVYDTDDSARLGAFEDTVVPLHRGLGKIVVPGGHFAVAAFYDTERHDTQLGVHELVLPQLTVHHDRRIALDFRRADHRVTFRTPRPARQTVSGFSLLRTARRSGPFYLDTSTTGGEPLYLGSEGQRAKVGGMRSYTYAQLASPGGATSPYTYNLLGPESDRTTARPQTTVAASSLATVDLRVYCDIASTGLQQELGIRPYEDEFPVLRPVLPIHLPLQRTEYLTAGAVQWDGGIAKYTTKSGGLLTWHDPQYQGVHHYVAGSTVAQDVGEFPLHPIAQTNFGNPASYFPLFPGAARSGDTEYLTVFPMGDNDPLDTPAGLPDSTYSFSVNGTTVDSGGTGKYGYLDPVEQHLPAGEATLGLTVTAQESGPKHVLSTGSQTTWTWRSERPAGGTLPPGMACTFDTTTRHCRVDPMMSVRYDVAGERLDGTTPAGRQVIGLRFGHIQYAARSAITSAAVAYSLNGTTWTPASVTGDGDTYRATFPVVPTSRSGQFVDLRVTGTDAAGGSISETLTRALWVRS